MFGIGQADFYRTRLTHSIETAQIARAIANNMLAEEPRLHRCLTSELAEAAALAHDLGHPPFGHAGERILDECMRTISRRARLNGRRALRFEANAQTFHILVAAEPKSPAYPGLNLTRATLAGVMKYPYEQGTGNAKFIFPPDMACARWAVERGTCINGARRPKGDSRLQTSITCQILNWADDCAYSIHDVEDALQAQFLRTGDLRDLQFSRSVAMRYEFVQESEALPRLTLAEIRERLRHLEKRIHPPETGDQRAHRKNAVRDMLNELITSVSVKRRGESSRPDYDWRLVVPDEARITSEICKSIIWEAVITDPRVAAMTNKGKDILKDLFLLFMEELVEKKSYAIFPRYYRPIVEQCLGKGEREAARAVCNFLALLTDMDAVRLHALLRGSKVSSLFDLI